MRTKSFLSVVLFFLVVAGTRSLQAQARETDRDVAPETASKLSKNYVAPFGVPLAPPILPDKFRAPLLWKSRDCGLHAGLQGRASSRGL
jgi:hypothetical protein